MAEINDILDKGNITTIKAVDTGIIALDDNVKKFITTLVSLTEALNKGGITFKQLADHEKTVKDNAKLLAEEQKKLTDIETKLNANTDAIVKAKIKATQATKEQKDRITQLVNEENKQLGTEQRLENEVKKLIAERKKLIETDKNYEADLKRINAQIDKNNALLKPNKSALEQQKIGIGGYTDGIKNALSQLGIMPPALTKVATATNLVTTATNTGSKAMNIFKIALASTGIGFLVLAVTSLIQYFKRTEEGAAKLQEILAPFKVLFGVLGDLMGKLGGALVSAFENPQKAVKDLWEGIKTNFVNRINALKGFISAFGDILKGVWELDGDKIKQGAKDAGNAYIDMITGVENTTGKLTEAIGAVYNEVAEKTKIQVGLEKSKLALIKETRKFNLLEAELTAKIAEDRVTANDQTDKSAKGIQIRMDAINRAIENNKKLEEARIAILQKQYNIKLKESKQADSDQATLDELNQIEVQLINIREEGSKKSIRLMSQKNTIQNESNTLLSKELKIKQDLAKEAEKEVFTLEEETNVPDIADDPKVQAAAQRAAAIIEIAKKADDEQLAASEISMQEAISLYESDLITFEQFEALKTEIAKTEAEKRTEIAQTAIQAFAMITDELVAGNQARIDRESEQNQQQRDYELQLAGDNKEKQAAANAKFAEKEKQIKVKQAKADKEAAIYKTLINIATAVVTMLTAGPVAGQILAGLAAAIGAFQLAKIVTTPIPKFFKGTQNAPAGVISVGEKGRELAETKTGKLLMFNKPTITSGLGGAKIYTNEQTERIMNTAGHDSPELRGAIFDSRIEKAIERGLSNQTHYSFETERVVKKRGNYSEIWYNRKLKGIRNDK
jgi:hypothetical protein